MATKKKEDTASGTSSAKPSWVTNLENQKSGSSSSGSSGSGGSSSGYRPLDSSGNDYASMVGMSDLDKAALEAAGQMCIRDRLASVTAQLTTLQTTIQEAAGNEEATGTPVVTTPIQGGGISTGTQVSTGAQMAAGTAGEP